MQKVLQQAANASLLIRRLDDADYKDPATGLLMCGKCHTPKQTHVKNSVIDITAWVLCECAQAEKAKQEAADKARMLAERAEREKRKCFGENDRKSAFTFGANDKKDAELTKLAQGYADKFAEMRKLGKGLLFYGPCGAGKTFLASCIANAVMEKGYTARVTTFAEIANKVQGTFEKEAVYNDLIAVDLLVLDDFAAERDTTFMHEIVFTVVDSRLAAKRPMIVTTNLQASDFNNPEDLERARILSRLKEACISVAVKGPDRRAERARAENPALRDYLLNG